ncbi:MAG: LysM domain-containing protein [Candidatus Riflebacteria bacterium]|nr:LysM domain-containing protein [Candidatus Riflebacteria bacterium]
MNKRHHSYLLTGFLLLAVASTAFGQYNDYQTPEGYSMAPPENEFYIEATPSVSADSSWVEEDSISTGYQTYTVRKGDTLGSIAKKFFGTTTKWKEIARANGISNAAKIKVGQTLEIPTTNYERGQGVTYRQRSHYVSSPSVAPNPGATTDLPLPPVTSANDAVLYSDSGLPQIILPGDQPTRSKETDHHVTFNGLTGLVNTFAAYPLGENMFSTAFGVVWNKITRRDGSRLRSGEDADYWEFPMLMTYAGENFEVAFKLPFESYDVFAPITYNFRDGSDSGMGDAALRLKFSSQNDEMASCLGLGAIFPTSDIDIGNTDTNNAWEVFAGLSSKRKEGGNIHLNGGYQAGDGNTNHEGVFVNAGFDYSANESFTFMGEVNFYNRINNGRSTDLTLGMRYHVKQGMSLTVAAPIALSNDMFFGYDYRLQGMLQYHY